MSVRATLRTRTAEAHERVDSLFSRFDLGTREGYGEFLTAQAEAFLAVESSLDAAGAERIIADWPARRRSEALIGDLADLGIDLPVPQPPLQLSGEEAIWGAAYVLEGSRLGGAFLKKDVPVELPRRFLDADQGPGAWRKLLEKLEEALYEPGRVEAAVKAAGQVFERFEAAARRYVKAG